MYNQHIHHLGYTRGCTTSTYTRVYREVYQEGVPGRHIPTYKQREGGMRRIVLSPSPSYEGIMRRTELSSP